MNVQNLEELRLLVIEDELLDFQIVERALASSRRKKFVISHVESLFQAFGFLASSNADVVLLDLNLEGSTGLETLRVFREHVPGMPVIVLSGNVSLEVALEAIQEGAMDFLVKGEFTEPILGRAICYALERKRLQQKLDDAELRLGPMVDSIAVCGDCKSVRDDLGFWGAFDEFLSAYTDTSVKSTQCPTCKEKGAEAA